MIHLFPRITGSTATAAFPPYAHCGLPWYKCSSSTLCDVGSDRDHVKRFLTPSDRTCPACQKVLLERLGPLELLDLVEL